MTEQRLTLKQQRFINSYLGEAKGNATAAARAAGYQGDDQTLRRTAADNLTNPHIRARIDEVMQAESLSAHEVLRELTAVASAPTEHFMQVIRPADDETGAPMQVRLDYSSKVKSLELLGKYHKLFTEKVEHSGNVSGSVEIKPIDYRAIVAPLLSDESET